MFKMSMAQTRKAMVCKQSRGEANAEVRNGRQPKADGEKRPATDTRNPEMQQKPI